MLQCPLARVSAFYRVDVLPGLAGLQWQSLLLQHGSESPASNQPASVMTSILRRLLLAQKPGSDLDDDEEDVTHIEQGEDLWQTRCDEEAMARGPGDAMAGGAEAGEVSPAVHDREICAFWDALHAKPHIVLTAETTRQPEARKRMSPR